MKKEKLFKGILRDFEDLTEKRIHFKISENTKGIVLQISEHFV